MFNPLGMLRRIRDDHDLTSTQKLVLTCAALRTDNSTGRVRASQEDLARDSGLSRQTVNNALHNNRVSHYLTLTKVNRRRVDLDWTTSVSTETTLTDSVSSRVSSRVSSTLTPSTSTSTTNTFHNNEEVVLGEEVIQKADLEASELLRKKLQGLAS